MILIELNTWYARASAAAAIGALLGAIVGALLSVIVGAFIGGMVILIPIATFLGATAGFVSRSIVEAGGGIAWRLIQGTKGLAKQKDYSYAQSLAARGHYEAAVAAYAGEAEADPGPAAPYLRAASILRDELGRHEDALEWLQRARRDAELDPGQEVFVTREIIALYTDKLGQPRRAIPELARLADRAEGTQTGAWAARELKRLRAHFELSAGRDETEEHHDD